MKTLNTYIILSLLVFGACSKKSSGDNNNATVIPNQPTTNPPAYNWNSYQPGYIPQGNCGSYTTLPSSCSGIYNGYNYCGNQWYYYWNNLYWSFPSTGSTCRNNNNNWWDDDDYNDDSDDDDDSCGSSCHDDDDNSGSSNYSSGWKKMWGTMGNSESRYITLKVPKNSMYYISFKGNYTGKKQNEEILKVKFIGGNTHTIKDLDQTHTGSSEVQKNCKVNVNFKLKGGYTYKIELSGNKDSVNNTYLRLTSYWPSDISKLCN